MPPVEEGCRTTSTSMSIITIQGKRSTAPSGIDIFELPFSRIRRRKKASLGDRRSVSPERSLREGRFGDDGIRFKIFWTSPIDADSQQLGSCTAQTLLGRELMAPATSGSVFPRDTIAAHKLWRSQKALSKKGEVLVEAVARRQGNAKGFNEWLEVVLRKMSDCVEVPYSSLLASIACVTGSSQHTFLMRRFKVEWGDKTTLDEGDDRRLVRKVVQQAPHWRYLRYWGSSGICSREQGPETGALYE